MPIRTFKPNRRVDSRIEAAHRTERAGPSNVAWNPPLVKATDKIDHPEHKLMIAKMNTTSECHRSEPIPFLTCPDTPGPVLPSC
jgi:hypothetical protein